MYVNEDCSNITELRSMLQSKIEENVGQNTYYGEGCD